MQDKLHLNKGSLIDFLNYQYLNDKPDQPKLKKDWFFGFLGGTSDKQVLKVFNKFIEDGLKSNTQVSIESQIKPQPTTKIPENQEIKTQETQGSARVTDSKTDDLAKDWNFFSYRADADLKNVQVIAFGEDHTYEAHRKYIGSGINANYREGDIILVEGIPRGTTIESDPETKYVNPGYLQMGWDIVKDSLFDQTKPVIENNALIKALEDFAEEMCPDLDNFTTENKKNIEARAEDFINKLDRFYDFFIEDPNERVAKKNKSLKILKTTSTFNLQNRAVLNYFITTVVDQGPCCTIALR